MDRWFQRGQQFASRGNVIDALREWLDKTNEETIGDVPQGRTGWLLFPSRHGQVKINADTRRDAVGRMLRAEDAGARWRVEENDHGVVNKVVFDTDPTTQVGWYVYLLEPLDAPAAF